MFDMWGKWKILLLFNSVEEGQIRTHVPKNPWSADDDFVCFGVVEGINLSDHWRTTRTKGKPIAYPLKVKPQSILLL